MPLSSKRVLVGVGGGIATYKTVTLVRELSRLGADVRVAMTRAATNFVTATTFGGITGYPAVTDLFDSRYPGEVHVELAEWADAIVIAPATANLMSRAVNGMADDVVLATLICSDCPVLMAPAMHTRMWEQPPTQRNVTQLLADGVTLVGPVAGALASGDVGMGRMAEPVDIAQATVRLLGTGDLRDVSVLISAGPTQEDIDPVRFISNRSSGRMGFALASVARDRGCKVTVVAGPTSVDPPAGVQVQRVRSALEMRDAVQAGLAGADVVIMTAAVSDYRPASPADAKIKKTADDMTVPLVKNPDILAELGKQRKGKRPVLVGFAMETHDLLEYAKGKLVSKGADLIVANEAAVGFGRDDTQATLVAHDGEIHLEPMSKSTLANHILDRVRDLLK